MTETTEQKNKAPEAPAAPPSAPPSKPKKSHDQQKKTRKRIKNGIIAVVSLAVVGVGGFFLWDNFIKEQPEEAGEAMTSMVSRGSIQSLVQGSGTTRAKDSATISPNAGGTILELMVKEGDWLEEGQPLYRMDDSDARDAVTAAQKKYDNTSKELQALYESVNDLSVTAPHGGKMVKVADLRMDEDVSKGQTVATVVDDTKLKLHLYYSYAYEDGIYVGQDAQVSIPATMGTISGKVETINKVEYVVPEGSVLFEVIVVVDNPGTLTEGMQATATLTDSSGDSIYPYEAVDLKYYQTTEVKAKVAGPVEELHLLNYGAVRAGQVLVRLGAKNNDEEIAGKENALQAALDELTKAQDELGKYNAVSPIAGTVISCNLIEGEKVENGQGLTIADTSVMIVDIFVDDRNIGFVKPGMMVSLNQYDSNMFMGVIETVSLSGKAENGVSVYPCTAKVDNPDGTLMTNMYLQYSFVASQSNDCLLVPVQAVQYVTLPGEGDEGMDPGMMDPGMMDPGMVDGEALPEGDVAVIPEGGDVLPEDGEALPEGDAALPEDGETLPEGDTALPEGDAALPEGGDIVAIPDVGVSGGTVIFPDGAVSGGAVSGGAVADVMIPRSAMSFSVSRPMGGGGNSGGMSRGGSATVVFVQGTGDDFMTPPPNAIEADPTWEFPEGFFPVVVEVGLADTTNVEIKSGLNEGDTVFIGYATQSFYG